MSIFVGSSEISSLSLGGNPIAEVYVGSTKVWPSVWDGGLIANGGFEDASNWTSNPVDVWVQDPVDEVMRIAVPSGGNDLLDDTSHNVQIGDTYDTEFDIVEWNGTGRMRIQFNGAVGAFHDDVGHFEETIGPTTGVAKLRFIAQISWGGAIDNVRMIDVTAQMRGPFPLESDPKQTYRIRVDTWKAGFPNGKEDEPNELWVPLKELTGPDTPEILGQAVKLGWRG